MNDFLPEGGGSQRPGDILRVVLVLFAIVGLAYGLDLGPDSGSAPPSAANAAAERDPEVVTTNTVSHAATNAEPRPLRLPQTAAACAASLKQAGVEYREIAPAAADGIAWPIRLTGPIGGITIEGGATPDAETNYLDCRLAATLLAWAPSLRARGIVGIEHYSMYRSLSRVNGSDKPSGHAAGRAIDIGRVELEDGRMLSVLTDWKNRKANANPCGGWRDDDAGRLLRDLACDAAQRGFFQVIVTPHHNAAHANHLHLEIDPSAESLWIR
ncbi:MAG TPA: extensin family protein [Polyangiales bacterium]|nr:extensin family protein [Polyangiales bacterium]